MFNQSWPVLWIRIDVISHSTRFTYPTVSSSQVSLPTVSRPLHWNNNAIGSDAFQLRLSRWTDRDGPTHPRMWTHSNRWHTFMTSSGGYGNRPSSLPPFLLQQVIFQATYGNYSNGLHFPSLQSRGSPSAHSWCNFCLQPHQAGPRWQVSHSNLIRVS